MGSFVHPVKRPRILFLIGILALVGIVVTYDLNGNPKSQNSQAEITEFDWEIDDKYDQDDSVAKISQ